MTVLPVLRSSPVLSPLPLASGANQKEKLKEHSITHVLSIHDTAEAKHPTVSSHCCIHTHTHSMTTRGLLEPA